MKRLLLLTILTALSLTAVAQAPVPANPIVIGQIDSLQSNILKEKRALWVHVPKSYVKGSTQRYPVVYLLDGDDHFSSVVGMIEQLADNSTICPDMIVVGIPNTDRTRDLTPSTPSDTLFRKLMPTAGGGEAFTSFLERELMPYIEAHYPADSYKLFIGHSLGGLMVINTLIHHPDLFNAYICIDPSMWWQEGKFLEETKRALASRTYPTKTLYLGLAHLLPPGVNIEQARADTSRRTRGMRYNLSLMDALAANTQNGLRYAGKYYPDDDHASVPLNTEYDGIRFIFKPYRVPFGYDTFFSPTFKADSAYVAHFEAASKLMGHHILPPEREVNSLGYTYLHNGPKHLAKAGALFKLNVTNYPQSYNAYDSYGDYFVTIKDTTNAMANFQKSLALKETVDTRKKLTELQAAGTVPPPVASTPKK